MKVNLPLLSYVLLLCCKSRHDDASSVPAKTAPVMTPTVTATTNKADAAARTSVVRAPATPPGPAVLDAGGNSTCLVVGGHVKCWGDLGHGNGKVTTVADIDSAIGVAVGQATEGDAFACALLKNGSVVCWGTQNDMTLPDGNRSNSHVPAPVRGINSAKAIAAGVNHVCALLESGELSCWGNNKYGQLGTCTGKSSTTPSPS